MSEKLQRLQAMGEQVARQLGFELVQVQLVKERGTWFLRYFLDRPGGISINDCESFSRRIDPMLDAEDPIPHSYTLEVSSAGLDRPLLKEADYERFAGRLVHLRLHEPIEGRRRWSGRLKGLEQGHDGRLAVLESEAGRLEIPYERIAQARLIPELDLK